MDSASAARAVAAATSLATSLGLASDDAVVLNASNALTVRLLPADVVARVTVAGTGAADGDGPGMEAAAVELRRAQALATAAAPIGLPDARVPVQVHVRDGFAITFWEHHGARGRPAIPAEEYADALVRLHAAMRRADLEADPVGRRVDAALDLLADPVRTPRLTDVERAELQGYLRESGARVGAADPQLLHGEPHPGNLLDAVGGVLAIDLETMCTGPVEFDLAHAPVEVAAHYPGVDAGLLADCRILARALATTWRWDREDALPGGKRLGITWLAELRDLAH